MDVNLTLATWSNLLIYSAMAVYAIAFVIHAFDLFGRDSKAVARKKAAPARSTARPQAKAGARKSRSSAMRTSRHTATAVLDAPYDDAAEASVGSTVDAGSAGGADDSAAASGPSRGDRRLARVGTALTALGLVLHVGAIVTRVMSVSRVPWGNMMEYLLTVSAIAGIVYLVSLRFRDFRYLGTFVTGGLLVALGLAITVFYTPAAPLVPALNSYWIFIHVPIAILATALLSVSAALAIFQIAKAWSEDRVEEGKDVPRVLGFLGRLPGSESIEAASYRIAAVGFIMWTFTLIAGAIWAEVAWGRYWGWDSKEIWTFVVWVVYAAYLHARATRGWSATKVAVLNLVGFSSVIFNFAIVNVFFNGLHAYSGL